MGKKGLKEEYRLQIQFVLVIYLICFILRIAEYLILRTDQTFWGESFAHKLLGLMLLIPALHFYGLNSKQVCSLMLVWV